MPVTSRIAAPNLALVAAASAASSADNLATVIRITLSSRGLTIGSIESLLTFPSALSAAAADFSLDTAAGFSLEATADFPLDSAADFSLDAVDFVWLVVVLPLAAILLPSLASAVLAALRLRKASYPKNPPAPTRPTTRTKMPAVMSW